MLSDELGEQLLRVRRAAGLTREQVAERCAEAGWPALTTAALGNIETGRRDQSGRRRREATVDELVVLAYVLDVPALSLLLPTATKVTVEALPGRIVSTADALAWLRGDRSFGRREPAAYAVLRLYVKADEASRELAELLGQWAPERAPDESHPVERGAEAVQDRPPGWHERFEATIERVREYRRQLRAFDHPRPPLPLGLEWVDPEPDASGGD